MFLIINYIYSLMYPQTLFYVLRPLYGLEQSYTWINCPRTAWVDHTMTAMLVPLDTDAAPVVVVLVMLNSDSTDTFSAVVDVVVVWQAETLTSRPLSQVSTSMAQ